MPRPFRVVSSVVAASAAAAVLTLAVHAQTGELDEAEKYRIVGTLFTPSTAAMLRHPLLSRLARQLLWGGYDEKGKLARPFRINDEGAFVGEDEAPVRKAAGREETPSAAAIHCWSSV